MNNEVFIQENTKYKLLGFIANLFLIFGLFIFPEVESLPQMPSWYSKMDLYLTLLLSIPLAWQFKSLFKKTGLKLSPRGLEENLSRVKSQNFSWDEIVTIKFIKIYLLKYILIYIKDPQSYLENQIFYKKISMRSNLKKFGTPIKIPIHFINKTPKEILDAISAYAKKSVPL